MLGLQHDVLPHPIHKASYAIPVRQYVILPNLYTHEFVAYINSLTQPANGAIKYITTSLLLKRCTELAECVKHYRTPTCKQRPMREYCITNRAGRILDRSEFAAAAENNAKRVKRSPKIYSARQQIIEHVIGTIKRQWGYDHILLKGLRKNDGSPLPRLWRLKRVRTHLSNL